MSTYQFFKSNSAESILIINGGQSSCPYVQPMKIPHPQISGQYSIGRMPCSSTCTLCEFDEDGGEWTTNCGSTSKTFKVSRFEPTEEPKSSLTLV